MRKNPKITIKARQDFVQFMYEKAMLYDKAIFHWWDERGLKDFIEWGKEKGLNFVDEKV